MFTEHSKSIQSWPKIVKLHQFGLPWVWHPGVASFRQEIGEALFPIIIEAPPAAFVVMVPTKACQVTVFVSKQTDLQIRQRYSQLLARGLNHVHFDKRHYIVRMYTGVHV